MAGRNVLNLTQESSGTLYGLRIVVLQLLRRALKVAMVTGQHLL